MAVKKKVTKKKTTTKRVTKNQFKKGHSKSKGFGRPPMTDAEKELSLKNRTEWKALLNKYIVTSEKELKALVRRTDLPAIDAMVVRSLVNTISSGDQSGMNWFLNHAMGKEKETSHINLTGGMENTNSINLKNLSKEELVALKAMAEKNNAKS